MSRPRSRDVVLIEVAALILALISVSGVLELSEDGMQRGLMIIGAAMSTSVLKYCWRRLLPGIIAAAILFGLATVAATAGAPALVPAALIGLAVLAIVSRNPDVRRAWAEGRWFRRPPAGSPQT
jgi:hypothetical protein